MSSFYEIAEFVRNDLIVVKNNIEKLSKNPRESLRRIFRWC